MKHNNDDVTGLYFLYTSRLNSNSASNVHTLTGKDFPVDFLRLNGGIFSFILKKL